MDVEEGADEAEDEDEEEEEARSPRRTRRVSTAGKVHTIPCHGWHLFSPFTPS